jgi:hypothetical protein
VTTQGYGVFVLTYCSCPVRSVGGGTFRFSLFLRYFCSFFRYFLLISSVPVVASSCTYLRGVSVESLLSQSASTSSLGQVCHYREERQSSTFRTSWIHFHSRCHYRRYFWVYTVTDSINQLHTNTCSIFKMAPCFTRTRPRHFIHPPIQKRRLP